MQSRAVRSTRASDTMAAMTTKPELLQAATAAAVRYIDGERDSRVAPLRDAELPEDLDGDFLDVPWPADAVLQLLADAGDVGATRSTGGRYFGFVTGGVEPIALAASTLAGAWDQNAALPAMSPLAARLDDIAARWIVELLELPPESVAAFCAGATVANLTGIITGRDALLERVGWSTRERGLAGSPPITVVTGDEVHAVGVEGAPTRRVRDRADRACADRRVRRVRAEAWPDTTGPTLVVLQAGNVNTGHSDPFDAILPDLDRDRTWVHIDGAFGLWARLAPDRRATIDGVKPPTRGRPTATSGSTRRMTAGS